MDSLPPVLWMLVITIIAGRESFFHDICFFYRASLGGPDERREQKFATLVGDHFGMSPTNILLTLSSLLLGFVQLFGKQFHPLCPVGQVRIDVVIC
ncbi:hypothetical protein C1N76_03525 [Geobacillus thermoleovorans]|uniref:Uncharacterized protein n=1 Tax=Geobacillus thermoleovorans TaxID=33941 RepID=A0A2Z3N700_GEOTH|nr:hypothetical protein C1N76_03525 [Geobacillus thermoleovorans]